MPETETKTQSEKTMTPHIADFGKKWTFTRHDLKIAHYCQEYQRHILNIRQPFTSEMVVPVILYSMFSAAQDTPMLIKTLDGLKRRKLLNIVGVTTNKEKAIPVLKRLRFPNQKINRFRKLESWINSTNGQTIINQIIKTSNSQGKNSLVTRNNFAIKSPDGIAYKTASLAVQITIENPKNAQVTVIDKWVLQFLKDCGHDVPVPDYKKVSGFSPKEYLKYEKVLSEMAETVGLSPSEFTLMIWCKVAYWEPNKYWARCFEQPKI